MSATISECGRYRYDLIRRWREGDLMLWIMLNPSTADAQRRRPHDPPLHRIRETRGLRRDRGREPLRPARHEPR
jgi:hypothetical protein